MCSSSLDLFGLFGDAKMIFRVKDSSGVWIKRTDPYYTAASRSEHNAATRCLIIYVAVMFMCWFRALCKRWRCSLGEFKKHFSSQNHKVSMCKSIQWVDLSFIFLCVYICIHCPLTSLSLSPSLSARAMLPKGGAGAVWCHETICQTGWTDRTRQIHRKSRTLVSGWVQTDEIRECVQRAQRQTLNISNF